MSNQPKQVFGPTINRIADCMAHTTRYAFRGSARLAADVGVSPATISRVLKGTERPSMALRDRITAALERDLGVRIDPRDLAVEDGAFPTTYICRALGCRGCIPEAAYDAHGNRLPAFWDMEPGHWVMSQFPHGLETKEVNA